MMAQAADAGVGFTFQGRSADGADNWAVTDGHIAVTEDRDVPVRHGPVVRAVRAPALEGEPDARVRGLRHHRRSEERRVGKECRFRGAPYPLKKKKKKDGEVV